MTKKKKQKDLLLMVESIANERGIEHELVFSALEEALAAVAAKRYEGNVGIRVAIDRESGEQETFRYWTVVSDLDAKVFPEEEEEILPIEQRMGITDAKQIDSNLEIGDTVEEPIENVDLKRVAAQQAKQVLLSKVREAERNKIVADYDKRIGELVTGIVKRVSRDNVIVDLNNNVEGLMTREEMIPRENFRLNDRIRAYLFATREEKRGPQVLLSRAKPEFLVELFKIEVPEISEEVIEIKAAARDPGSRAKIAVKTNDGRIDPIGACVGMRGSRVQAVSNELHGERIDIVLWDDNPAQLAINAMAPAEVVSIVADELSHTMDIAVSEEQLAQAIGRNGQNVRLASQLTGWTLNVMSEGAAQTKQTTEVETLKNLFMKELDVDAEVAGALVEAGFSSLDEIAYIDTDEFKQLGLFDETTVVELQRRASDVLLAQELAGEAEIEGTAEVDDDLMSLDGMTEELAQQLVDNSITTREELADLAVDELVDIGVEANLASKLIMEARKPWFV